MAFCANCGARVDGQFCEKCGSRVGAAPPAYQPPAGSAAQPIAKKKGPLFWVLTGCLGVIVIGGILTVAGGLFIWNKAKQAGFDPALMKSNPGLAVAKMVAATNPDIEILGVDEEHGIIKVRDKKDGKTLTMSLAEAKNGKIVFLDDKNQKVELQVQGEGDKTSMEIRGPKGTMQMGGAPQLPDWLPAYPGAQSVGGFSGNSEEGKAASYGFTTKDAVEKVTSFYEEAFKKAGLQVRNQALGDGGAMVAGEDGTQTRTAQVMVIHTDQGTSVTITFESKK